MALRDAAKAYAADPRRAARQLHDYTTQRWGHAFHSLDHDDAYAGHGPAVGPKIRVGDWILTKMKSGRVGRMLVTEIRYTTNVHDMWFAKLQHDGYTQ